MSPSTVLLNSNGITEDAKAPSDLNKRWENEYKVMLNGVAKKINQVLKSFQPDDPKASVKIIKILKQYSKDIKKWSQGKVGKLIYNMNNDSAKKWRTQSLVMSKGLRYAIEHVPLEPMLRQYLKDNVKLITSMPLQAAERVQNLVMENLKTGQYRPEGLVPQIMNIGNITKNRAKLIARTEVARITTGLAKARAESVGVGWYVWKTSHDARVRSSHAHMDKVLIRWNDPPSPETLDGQKKSYGHYHPGEIFNCRCQPRPFLRISDISWPAKVYIDGEIKMMRKVDFIKLSEGEIPIAA